MIHHNFRRRVNGTRISESGLPKILGNIRKIDIGSSLSLKNQKEYSLVSEELNHYLAFTEEEANYELRKRKFEDEEHVKLYLDENPELKNIVTTLVDSCIVYDKDNQFCTFNPNKKIYSYTDNQEKLLNDLYSKHVKLLNFNREQEAWSTFYDWTASGKVCYEIIYKTITKKEKESIIAKEKEKVSLCESKLKSLSENLVSLNENKDDPSNKRKRSNISIDISRYKKMKSESLNEIKKLDKNEKIKGMFTQLNEDVFLEYYREVEKKMSEYREEEETEEETVLKKYERIKKSNGDELIPVEIVGIKRLAFNSVTRVDVIGENGENVPMYKAMDYRGKYYYLPQQCVIEVDWGKVSGNSRFSYKSYVDSLRRNYNLTRSLEESRVAWNILVGQFRLKMIVPTGSQIGAKAKEAVRKLVNQYRERLTISSSDGVISVNGEKNYPFGKNIALPSRSGNTTSIDSIEYKGVDLKNMDVVNYFRDATYRDSDIPKSRFDRDNNFGNLLLFKNDGIPFDELFFYKKSKRLLNEFSKIIRLPMYYDAILKDPVLSLDDDFYNSIQIVFNADSYFELAKEQEIEKAKLGNLSAFERLQDSSREPIFSMRFLLTEKFKIISQNEWDLNQQFVDEDKAKQSPQE
jgi:hypothetical protein